MIHEVLRGGYTKAAEAGVIISGGQTLSTVQNEDFLAAYT